MKAGRKLTGGRYKKPKKVKKTGRQKQARIVKLNPIKRKILRIRGGSEKLVGLSYDTANIIIKGKAKKAEIKNVIETPANIFLARQNILVKGAIIETNLGNAKITNRPSQEGQVQAVLIN